MKESKLFINPYNFILPDRNVSKKPFIDFTKFHSNQYSGQLTISIKSVDDIPIFIPDSQKKKFLILLDVDSVSGINLNEEHYFKISKEKSKEKIESCDSLPEIKPIGQYKTSEELLDALRDRAKCVWGKLRQIAVDAKGTKKFCIETDDPGPYDNKAHKVMEFCKDPVDNPILPSTTIKGLIRNVVEILSNSCFSFYDKEQIFYRLNPSNISDQKEISSLSQGTYIVKDFDKDGNAGVVKLDSAKVNTSFFIEDELKKGLVWAAVVYDKATNKPEYIKRISKKDAIYKLDNGKEFGCVAGLNKYFRKENKNLRAKAVKIESSNVTNLITTQFYYQADISINGKKIQYCEPRLKNVENELFYAKIYKKIYKKMVGPKKGFEKYYLKEINEDIHELGRVDDDKDEKIVQCKLKRSGDIETKTQDILCFKYDKQNLQAYVDEVSPVIISKQIVEQYNEVLKQRKSNLRGKGKDEPKSLKKGDLVFYNQGYLSYTQIPRKKYQYSIGDIVERDSQIPKLCDTINKLCPACNMFGSTELKDGDKQLAISGKVSFGTGRLVNSSVKLEENAPLKILSSPKPSCNCFYLLNGDYNNIESKIRGRKLYYHHSKDKLEYQRGYKDSKEGITIDNQNISIEALKNFEFKSTVDFINLSKYELGLILFALTLINKKGKKVYHKLGMGKSLGLGTVRIEIDKESSFLINRQKRYKYFLNQDGEIEKGKELLQVPEFIEIFQKEQKNIFNKDKNSNEVKSDFYEIPYISDLFDILEINSLPGDYHEIKFPRKTDAGEPRGFKWFEDEQKRKSYPQKLPLPSEVKNRTKTLNEWS